MELYDPRKKDKTIDKLASIAGLLNKINIIQEVRQQKEPTMLNEIFKEALKDKETREIFLKKVKSLITNITFSQDDKNTIKKQIVKAVIDTCDLEEEGKDVFCEIQEEIIAKIKSGILGHISFDLKVK